MLRDDLDDVDDLEKLLVVNDDDLEKLLADDDDDLEEFLIDDVDNDSNKLSDSELLGCDSKLKKELEELDGQRKLYEIAKEKERIAFETLQSARREHELYIQHKKELEEHLDTIRQDIISFNEKRVNNENYCGDELFPKKKIIDILKSFHVRYQISCCLPISGTGNYKYDFIVFRNDKSVAFLIEYDGPSHYDVNAVRVPCNGQLGYLDLYCNVSTGVKKAGVAANHNIPVLYLTMLHRDIMRDILMAWVFYYVDNLIVFNKLIAAILMHDKYGWDFDFNADKCSGYSDKVDEFLRIRNDFIKSFGPINYWNWDKFFKLLEFDKRGNFKGRKIVNKK